MGAPSFQTFTNAEIAIRYSARRETSRPVEIKDGLGRRFRDRTASARAD